jgi:DNA-binding CsgD family transcriptional regulator
MCELAYEMQALHSLFMSRVITGTALVYALLAFLLQWLQFRMEMQFLSEEVSLGSIALVFLMLGLWAGLRLGNPPGREKQRPFNAKAIRERGVTRREQEVLCLLAIGKTNAEIARQLGISGNTVKTHISRLYAKLEVHQRVQAIRKAKTLALIP